MSSENNSQTVKDLAVCLRDDLRTLHTLISKLTLRVDDLEDDILLNEASPNGDVEFCGRSVVSGCEPFKITNQSYLGTLCVYNSKRHNWAYDAKKASGLYIISFFTNLELPPPNLNSDDLIDLYEVRPQYAAIQSAGVCFQNEMDHDLQSCLIFPSGDVLPLLNPSLPF